MKKKHLNNINQICKNFREDNQYMFLKKDKIIATSSDEDSLRGFHVIRLGDEAMIDELSVFKGYCLNGKEVYNFIKENVNKDNPEFEVKPKEHKIKLKGSQYDIYFDIDKSIVKRHKYFIKTFNIDVNACFENKGDDITEHIEKLISYKRCFNIPIENHFFKLHKSFIKGYSKGDKVYMNLRDIDGIDKLKMCAINIVNSKLDINILNIFIIMPMF